MKNALNKQQGFLILICVILILVIGSIGIAVTYMLSGSAAATNSFSESEKAFYLAESGLQKGSRFLLTPFLSGTASRNTCASITGDVDLTNSSFGSGTFTVTTVSGSPYFSSTTLSSALTAASTTVPVASITGFAASGRILIDLEAIDYTGISGTNFVGVTRGANGTLASAHAANAVVSQYQCTLDSKGGIPNLTAPLFRRELQQSVQLQEAWAVGANTGTAFVFTHWNRPTQLAWTAATFASAVDQPLADISLLSNADGWAVGTATSTNLIIFRLSGSGWSTSFVSGGCSGQVLNSVSAVSSQEAWVVGDRNTCKSGVRRFTIAKWNGSTWTQLAPPTIPADAAANQNLLHVHVIDTDGTGTGNIGFAVGVNGQTLMYNGSTWTASTSGTSTQLNSVHVVSANEAWAVGNNGIIRRWNGSTWAPFTSPTATTLNAIYMIDTNGDGLADVGWAVGNSGVAITYNGASWSLQSPGGGNLLGVSMYHANDVWACGATGRVIHWDGSTWTAFSSGITQTLNSIAVVPQGQFGTSGWQEVFP